MLAEDQAQNNGNDQDGKYDEEDLPDEQQQIEAIRRMHLNEVQDQTLDQLQMLENIRR